MELAQLYTCTLFQPDSTRARGCVFIVCVTGSYRVICQRRLIKNTLNVLNKRIFSRILVLRLYGAAEFLTVLYLHIHVLGVEEDRLWVRDWWEQNPQAIMHGCKN